MRYPVILLLFFFTWQAAAQDKEQTDIIYDTVVVEKPPVYINKQVYYSETRQNSGKFFMQGGVGIAGFTPSMEFLPNGYVKRNNDYWTLKTHLLAGYQGDFFQYATGVSVFHFNSGRKALSWSMRYDTSNVQVQDTLDSYYSVQNGDTTWHYITEWKTITNIDSSREMNTFTARYSVISIPFFIGYPVYYKRFLFNPQIGFTANLFFINASHDGDDIQEERKFFLRPGINFLFDIGYRVSDNKYIFSRLHYSLFPGQRRRQDPHAFVKTYGIDFGIKFFL